MKTTNRGVDLDEERLRRRIFDAVVLFLNRYPMCKCLSSIGAGNRLLIDYEIETAKLRRGKKRLKGVEGGLYYTLGKKVGMTAIGVYMHHQRHGKKQVVAVNELIDELIRIMEEEYNNTDG
jgi:hypothetical protein